MLYEGAGPVLADADRYRVSPGAVFKTMTVKDPSVGNALTYADFYTTNTEDALAMVRTSHGNQWHHGGYQQHKQSLME